MSGFHDARIAGIESSYLDLARRLDETKRQHARAYRKAVRRLGALCLLLAVAVVVTGWIAYRRADPARANAKIVELQSRARERTAVASEERATGNNARTELATARAHSDAKVATVRATVAAATSPADSAAALPLAMETIDALLAERIPASAAVVSLGNAADLAVLASYDCQEASGLLVKQHERDVSAAHRDGVADGIKGTLLVTALVTGTLKLLAIFGGL